MELEFLIDFEAFWEGLGRVWEGFGEALGRVRGDFRRFRGGKCLGNFNLKFWLHVPLLRAFFSCYPVKVEASTKNSVTITEQNERWPGGSREALK